MFAAVPLEPVPNNSDATALPVVVLSVAAVGPEVMPRVKVKSMERTSVEFTCSISVMNPNFKPWLWNCFELLI